MVGVYQIKVHRGIVYKSLRTDNEVGEKLWKRLRRPKNRQFFKNLIENMSKDPILGHHVVIGKCSNQRADYHSPLIQGYGLSEDERILNLVIYQLVNILTSIAVLLKSLGEYHRSHGYLMGDWTLHNLIYQVSTGLILNIDLEGFYTYSPFGLSLSWNSGECRWKTVRDRLKTLQFKLLGVIFHSFSEKDLSKINCLTMLDLPGQYQLVFPGKLVNHLPSLADYFSYLSLTDNGVTPTSTPINSLTSSENILAYQVYLKLDRQQLSYLLVDIDNPPEIFQATSSLSSSPWRKWFKFKVNSQVAKLRFVYKINPLRSKIVSQPLLVN